MSKTFLKRMGSTGGFTLLEALVVTAVIAVLAFMAVPSMMSAVPNYQARKATEATSSLMYMARMTAAGTQKPTRAVVDCQSSPCRLRMYTAVFNKDGELAGWSQITNAARNVNSKVRMTIASSSTKLTSGKATLYWVVFVPKGGLVAASHSPFTLIVQPGKRSKPSWAVSVNNITGRVAVRSNN